MIGAIPALFTNCTGGGAGKDTLTESAVQTDLTIKDSFFDLSLAQWSRHKTLFSGQMTNMDFPGRANNDFDIDVVEYVSVFFTKRSKTRPTCRNSCSVAATSASAIT